MMYNIFRLGGGGNTPVQFNKATEGSKIHSGDNTVASPAM